MEIYLIRHPRPDIPNDVCYGRSDVPLSKQWAEECKSVLGRLPRVLDAVFTSPLSRCSMFAKQIQANRHFVDRRLLELDFGLWESKRWKEIDQKDLSEWMKDYVNCKPPGGESFADLHKRTNDFLGELTKCDIRRVAVVTHAGVIRSLIVRILDIPLTSAFRVEIDCASISKIIVDPAASKVCFLNNWK